MRSLPSQIGIKYGRLTIIDEIKEKNRRIAICNCDCGNTHSAPTSKIKCGHTTSCGCYNLENLKRPRLESQEGKRYGRLFVVEDEMIGGIKRKVRVVCDCGKEIIRRLSLIRSGKTSSCGCYKSEMLIEKNIKHSMSYSPEYRIWSTMIQRCTNPKNCRYSYYGGRGISVCNEWMEFGNFINDMGTRPSNKYSIDRIDNNGNYCKENCRWADRFTQMNNTRKNIKRLAGEQKKQSDQVLHPLGYPYFLI